MWAGLECTVNRVNDRFVSQCDKSKHFSRMKDLEKFAALGVERLRYPALWEMVSPDFEDVVDWRILDLQLGEMKRLGLRPIVGLLHHGSGPRFTSLIDPNFAEKFSRYARAFAERYPWVEDYTPINEILTTACFSCLYGHWYPHSTSDHDFVFAVYNQTRATILAMAEIRKIIPQARLIQTEDFGRAQASPELQYQADFQNERRWLSFDMLCGRIHQLHPIYPYLKRSGFGFGDLTWLQENQCPPDIIGINHYLLSNRFLDIRLDAYPSCYHGGNGIHQYADLGAVQVPGILSPTPSLLCTEVWNRYKIAIAITEVHQCGSREAQMRWLHQVWHESCELRKAGVDIRAVTAWSLLGTYDWHRLCTIDENFYESGIFDLRAPSGEPKETVLAQMVKQYAADKEFTHPVLEKSGWWVRDKQNLKKNPNRRKILITGGRGTLATAFARICDERDLDYILLARADLDIADKSAVDRVLSHIKPWAIINAAGYVNVDKAERENEKCYRDNVVGAVNLAGWCADQKIQFVSFSSDLVFDGLVETSYNESHSVSPLNIYGKSKAESEKRILEILPEALVIRTSSFFGPWDESNFITKTLRSLNSRQQVFVPSDISVSPTYVPDLVHHTLDILLDSEKGIVHLVNDGALSWSNFARLAVRNAGVRREKSWDSLLVERSIASFNYAAIRPKNSVLVSERVSILPSIENAMGRYFSEIENRI